MTNKLQNLQRKEKKLIRANKVLEKKKKRRLPLSKNKPIKKWGKYMYRQINKEDTLWQIRIWEYSQHHFSLINCKLKTLMRYHYTRIRMAKKSKTWQYLMLPRVQNKGTCIHCLHSVTMQPSNHAPKDLSNWVENLFLHNSER